MTSEESIAAAKRWFAFVKDLNEREPKTPKIERKPVPPSTSTSQSREKRVSLTTCKYCLTPFITSDRPSCPRFNGPCSGVSEGSAAIVVAVYCRWCGDMFTLTNRPKCRMMYDSYCHTRSEPLP
jgi:hypothetical protein